MKSILDSEEKEILISYENDEWISAPNLKERKTMFREMAKETLKQRISSLETKVGN